MGVLYDIVTDQETLIQRISREVAQRKEEFLWQQFERHGFSRETIADLLREDRVTIITHGVWNDYCIDGIAYFGVSELPVEDGRIYAIECRDILKPGVGGNAI